MTQSTGTCTTTVFAKSFLRTPDKLSAVEVSNVRHVRQTADLIFLQFKLFLLIHVIQRVNLQKCELGVIFKEKQVSKYTFPVFFPAGITKCRCILAQNHGRRSSATWRINKHHEHMQTTVGKDDVLPMFSVQMKRF